MRFAIRGNGPLLAQVGAPRPHRPVYPWQRLPHTPTATTRQYRCCRYPARSMSPNVTNIAALALISGVLLFTAFCAIMLVRTRARASATTAAYLREHARARRRAGTHPRAAVRRCAGLRDLARRRRPAGNHRRHVDHRAARNAARHSHVRRLARCARLARTGQRRRERCARAAKAFRCR